MRITFFGNSGFVVGGWRSAQAGMRQFRMKDHELYRRILGIEAPWQVDWVDLKLDVEADSARNGSVDLRHHTAAIVENAALSSAKTMRDDITFF